MSADDVARANQLQRDIDAANSEAERLRLANEAVKATEEANRQIASRTSRQVTNPDGTLR